MPRRRRRLPPPASSRSRPRSSRSGRGWVKPAQADLNGSGPFDHDRPHCPNCVARAATIAALFRWCDYRSLNARAPPRPLCVPLKIQPLESLRQPGIETPPAGARCTAAAAQICANISGDRKRLIHGRPSRKRAETARRIVTDPAAPSAEGLWDAAREAQQERADRCGVNRNAGEYEEFRHRVEVGT